MDKLFDDVAEYNYYRNIVCIVIGALVIVIGLLALIGALPIKKGVSVGFLRASVAIRAGLTFMGYNYDHFFPRGLI